MFLLHPRVSQIINARSLYRPFVGEGVQGSLADVVHSQQSNRLLAFGQQCLASTGGTASLCGGAAGPGGGPAGASGAPFSGAASVSAGGSNGAAGGVPVGGQENGRQTGLVFSPYLMDDLTEVEPITPGVGGFLMRGAANLPGGSASSTLSAGPTSGSGNLTNGMPVAANFGQLPGPSPDGSKTCPHPPSQ